MTPDEAAGQSNVPIAAAEPALLADVRFARFVLAKFLQLLAQNALVYGLFILVIRAQDSALATSAFVLTSVLPSILLSLPGGVVADALPRKLTLLVSLALRIAIAVLFLFYEAGLLSIMLLTAATWTVYQFYSPAESAALPAVVPRHRLPRATAILQIASLFAQVGGAGLLAPVMLTYAGGERSLFITVTGLLAGAWLALASVQRLTPESTARGQRTGWLSAMPRGLRLIRADRRLLSSTALRVLLDSAFGMLVVAAPLFVSAILHAPPESTVYIVSPAAIGLAAGLFLAPPLTRLISGTRTAWAGFVLVVSVIFALALIEDAALLLDERAFLPLSWLQETFGVRREIAASMLVLPFAGLGMSLVQVASRALVYEVAPATAIAQVFATQSGIGSLASLLPILLSGVMLDLLPVRAVLIFIGAALALLAPYISLRLAGGARQPEALTPG